MKNSFFSRFTPQEPKFFPMLKRLSEILTSSSDLLVESMQHDKPEDFVIATGVQHSVREFATLAFHHAGIEVEWQGSGMDEKGINKANGKVIVEVSPDFYRPTDVVNLWGDPTKAKTELGWNPTKTTFEELVKIMVAHDMELVKNEK